MKLYTLCLGNLATNCYMVTNEETKECVIIDPAAEFNRIDNTIKTFKLKPVAVFLTHAHFDHVLAMPEARDAYGVPVYIEETEEDILEDTQMNLSAYHGFGFISHADKLINDGDVLEIAGFKIKALKTPGHTSGSLSYYFEKEKALFDGDVLFKQSYGRSDYPTGNNFVLGKSIREVIFKLPGDVTIYPGHGQATTVEFERLHNPVNSAIL